MRILRLRSSSEKLWSLDAPEAWGHDIDVPDMMLYATTRVSSGYPDIVFASDHAARMSTPGAVRSG